MTVITADLMTAGTALIDLARERRPGAGATRVIAIDGPACSGKTKLGDEVTTRLHADGQRVEIVHMDDLYPGWDGLAQGIPALVGWVLGPLAGGGRAGYRRYDWRIGDYAEWRTLPPVDWLVVEGVGCGSRAAAKYVCTLGWVDASLTVRFDRGMTRDGETFRPHWQRWAHQEEHLFALERTRERADVILDTAPAENDIDAVVDSVAGR